MDINKKIEEIRRQPEHIRLRWVWGMTAGFTVVVILIWIILLKSRPVSMPVDFSSENANFADEFSQQKKSIEDAARELKSVVNKTNPNGIPPVSDGASNAEKSPDEKQDTSAN